MTYTKKDILDLEQQMNFNRSNLEKVIRLLDALEFLFTKSKFKDVLILKGGTAINLILTNLKRLSVDVDLDYHGSLIREKSLEDRKNIEKELDDFMLENGYTKSKYSRDHFALLSRTYGYTNVSGNIDYIKVEVNFMDRISLYKPIRAKIEYFNKSFEIYSLEKEELYGMKLAALLNRSKPRDIFDSDVLFSNLDNFDLIKLKKCAIFYLSLDKMFSFDNNIFNDIRNTKYFDVKKELYPVLPKGFVYKISEVTESIVYNVNKLMVLDEKEKQYLAEFSKGNYDPYLLFDEEVASRAINHPMAKWKVLNINKE